MHRRIRSFAPIGGSLLRNAAGSTKNQKRKYAMTLQIYSTLSKDIRPFTPIEPGKVGMYVCGVTVYDYTHIGHGRTFVAFDVVRRWLEASGYAVTFVRNVTDIDDKILDKAAAAGQQWWERAYIYERESRVPCAHVRAARHRIHPSDAQPC